ncbi:hypothetical protein [Amycolatopsis keratiniphila]|uniref:hypothetical protein n=1 Tax=Amycolatopsis keratiniphila TaxID=129921 RepID=UPI000AA71F37|nr:hypothetical protein [Amycolatopsis keratiniphila]
MTAWDVDAFGVLCEALARYSVTTALVNGSALLVPGGGGLVPNPTLKVQAGSERTFLTFAARFGPDLLLYGLDLLDLYRGPLSYRRVCALVAHLPDDAAVWRMRHPHGAMTRAKLVLTTVERRVTALWATVAIALGRTSRCSGGRAAGHAASSRACPDDPCARRCGAEVAARNRAMDAWRLTFPMWQGSRH